jgi:hypothetical protein
MIPAAYRALLRDPRTRRLLAGLGISSLGDGMSTVTIAWLAVRVAPAVRLGLFFGLPADAAALWRHERSAPIRNREASSTEPHLA